MELELLANEHSVGYLPFARKWSVTITLSSTEIAFLMAVSCLPITRPSMFTRLWTSTADILVKISELLSIFKLQFTYKLHVCPQLIMPFYPVLNWALFTFLLILLAKAKAISFASWKQVMFSEWLNGTELPQFTPACSQTADSTIAMLFQN